MVVSKSRKGVVGIVEFEGKYLLGKKKTDGTSLLSGQWHIPGEKIEEGETDEQALVRGLIEEAGIRLTNYSKICESTLSSGMMISWYYCQSTTGLLQVGSDLDEAGWFEKEAVTGKCSQTAVDNWPDEVKALFRAQVE